MARLTATKTAAPAVVFRSLPHLLHQVWGSLHPHRLQNLARYSFWQDQPSRSIVLLGVNVPTVITGCKFAA
jgi:hypothetical protein